jgi:putative ABC transport system permease protein
MDLYLTAIIQGLAFSVMGIGIYLTLRIFNIPDITTDGSYTLGGSVTVVLLVGGHPPWIALMFTILAGMIAGTATGIIHTKLKVNALLAGILVMTALYSVNLAVMGRPNIPLINTPSIFNENHFLVVTLFTVIAAVLIILFLKTDLGIAMRATGSSEDMVRANGVNTSAIKILGIAIANGLTAVSGFLMVQYQGFSDINMGIGIVISGLAAVILGESLISLTGAKGIAAGVIAVILGSVAFRLILAAALAAGMDPNYLKLTTAMIVLLILGVTAVKSRRGAGL